MTASQLCSECLHPRPGFHKPRCTAGVTELLDTITDEYPWLTIRRDQLNAMGEGGSLGFVSAPPIDLTTRAHRDPESKPWRYGPDDTDHPTLGVDHTLRYWSTVAARAGGNYTDAAWVVHQPWVGDMVRQLRTLATQLKSATGAPPPKPIGHCRRVAGLDPETRDLVVCGQPLFMPDGVEPKGRDESIADLPHIRCPAPNCNELYTGADLIRIRLVEEQDRRRPTTRTLPSSREGSFDREWATVEDERQENGPMTTDEYADTQTAPPIKLTPTQAAKVATRELGRLVPAATVRSWLIRDQVATHGPKARRMVDAADLVDLLEYIKRHPNRPLSARRIRTAA